MMAGENEQDDYPRGRHMISPQKQSSRGHGMNDTYADFDEDNNSPGMMTREEYDSEDEEHS